MVKTLALATLGPQLHFMRTTALLPQYSALLAQALHLPIIPFLSTTLPNWFIPDTHFPVLLSTVIRSRFQVKPATLLIPIDLFFPFFWWRSFTVPGAKMAPFP